MEKVLKSFVSPIGRASRFTKCYKNYLLEQQTKKVSNIIEESDYHTNVFDLDDNDQLDKSVSYPLGRTDGSAVYHKEYPKGYGDIGNDKYKSGVIIDVPRIPGILDIDNNLKLLTALQRERNLLSNIGLDFDPNDEIYTIKDNNGSLLAVMAVSRDKLNKIDKINFVDVDYNAVNFKKALARFLEHNIVGGTACFYDNIDISRYEIRKEVLRIE